ncbi:polysaccharide biosynthesis tyrosine autokinase [Arthrobacter sp. SAFR-179]|uniref:polysaccharide biosynthesis tyrosine autokinase n=1 Tax=Arthrobacter sp. SAFR-179 TaxID=3387279 RepID=UPI003F7B58DE
MDLQEYLRVIRRHWILLIASILAGLLVGGLISIISKPTYTSDTQLFVAIQNSGSVQELQQGNTFTQARVQSYVQTATTPVVLQPVIETLGLTGTPEELAQRVKATSDLNTVLIKISVVDSSPVRASATAQAVADSFMRTVENLERPKNGGESPVSLSIVSPAVAPTAPSSPNTRLNLILGLLAGLAVGIGVSLLRGLLDYRVQGEADLRKSTDAPILGGIAFDSSASKNPLLTQTNQQSPRAESFRQLRTNLQFANVTENAKSVLVTSSLPGEGKSTTATNLAIALAQAGQSVCLIDADLRRPVVGEYLGIDRNVGLTTALIGAVDVHDVLQPWGEDNLFVLASGQIPPNPSELLGSTQMRLLIENLEQVFDSVIIDAPPLLPVTDAAVLSQHVGGVMMVVGSRRIKHHDLEKSFRALDLVNANVLGVVLNLLPTKGPDAYAYSYYTKSGGPQSTNVGRNIGVSPNRMLDELSDRQDWESRTESRRAAKFPQRLSE